VVVTINIGRKCLAVRQILAHNVGSYVLETVAAHNSVDILGSYAIALQ
jgi:flagellar motor switch/type III secretory pathway protein FliN